MPMCFVSMNIMSSLKGNGIIGFPCRDDQTIVRPSAP